MQPFIYNFRNFWKVQKQAKITEFTLQINDKGILGNITNIRLRQLQTLLWLPNHLLKEYPFSKVPKKFNYSYLLNMLDLLKKEEFTFEINRQIVTQTSGGKTPIIHLM